MRCGQRAELESKRADLLRRQEEEEHREQREALVAQFVAERSADEVRMTLANKRPLFWLPSLRTLVSALVNVRCLLLSLNRVVVWSRQATARRCLEAASWELPAAIATHEEEERQRRDGLVAQFMAERYADDATARRHLEQEGWELEPAMASYMPPVPDSPVAGRSLATSNFKTAYIEASVPEGPMDLGVLLGDLIRAYCQQEGIDWKAEGQPFLKELQAEAMRNMDDPIDEMMQRMCGHALRSDCYALKL